MKSSIWSLDVARTHHRFSPGIANGLMKVIPKNSPVIDLGCGRGDYLRVLTDGGHRCLGVEGTSGIRVIASIADIIEADLTRPLDINWPRSTVLCLEVAEHVHREHETTLLDNIDRYCDSMLVLSWAVLGQRGHGHVNCRPNSYVCRVFRERGYDFLAEPTFFLREQAERDVRYFQNTLLVFERSSASR